MTQVGQIDGRTALAVARTAWVLRGVFVDGALENCVSVVATSGSCVSLYSAQRLLQREATLLLEAKKAARECRPVSLMPKPPFLMHTWAQSQDSWVLASWMISPRHFHQGGLHPLRTEVDAVWRHRASVAANLAPAEADAKEDEVAGDWRRTSWAMSLSARCNFSRTLRRQKSRRPKVAQQREALVVADRPPHWGLHGVNW